MRDRLRRHRLLLLVVVAAIAVLAAFLARPRGHRVLVADAFVGTLDLRIAASGLVEADGADLSFAGNGRITSIAVEEGQAVSRSQALAWLEPVGSLPGADGVVDAIRAPYDGTVVDIYLRAGSVVVAGQAVLRIVSSEGTWVTAFIESEDAMQLQPGQRLRCRAGGYLSRPWGVVVRAVGKEALPRQNLQGSARQVRVRCQPVNPAFPIPPGTEVDIDGDVPLAADAVLVPTNAVVRDGPHDYVWVADGSRVHRREVEIGPNNFDLIQVHSGLAAGETVVTEGKQGLAEGDRARATRLERGAGGQQGGP